MCMWEGIYQAPFSAHTIIFSYCHYPLSRNLYFFPVDQFCCNKDVNFDTTACFFCNHNVSILFVCVCVCVCVSPGSPPSNAYFMGTIPANNISVLSIFFVCVSPGSPITSNAHFMGDLAGNSSKKSVLSIELYF